eukprot:TRINITY_DN5172_c0_g1_i2.p1 TRINITY_DN5172_c0_g1~~TRINITY_DN5172_c0_g1_i2.p1  ORF type:complete len:319 (-),score=66.06 TRINITY_DN5172_c0_g1_i2:196-1152(-)
MNRFVAVAATTLLLSLCVSCIPLTSSHASAKNGFSSAQRVLAIGLDGMGGLPYFAGVENLPQTLQSLSLRGAWTLNARGVMITDSKPNWSAIFMGAGPEETGIDGNGWEAPPNDAAVDPITGKGTLFPSMFSAVKAHNNTLRTALFTDHDVVVNLVDMEDIDHFNYNKDADVLTRDFIDVMNSPAGPPELMFIHYDMIDAAGHLRGWGSQHYYDAVARADSLVSQLLSTLDRKGLLSSTLVIITSDHGGQLRSHGIFSNQCLIIPFIVNGPCVNAGIHLDGYIRNMDYPPTILHALGVPSPSVWIGRPLSEAFNSDCR